jgi:hypothetical protein
MPMTKLQERARKKYVTVKEFAEQYNMSRAQAYRITDLPEMKEAIIKTGTRNKKVDLDRAFEIMQQIFG